MPQSNLNFKAVQYWTELNPSKAYAEVGLRREDGMRRNNRQPRVVADFAAAATNLTDTTGNPSESYHWGHLAALRREWMNEFWRPRVDAFEMTLAEIRAIESRVRRELYP